MLFYCLYAQSISFRVFDRCEECSSKVEKSQDSLKDVEDLMAKINVRNKGEEIRMVFW